MVYRITFSMGNIFIFDIDGCIMPNIFPFVKDIKIENEINNQEIIKKASNLSLFPEFIEFYKRNCRDSLAVYFLTGRKQKYYGKTTEKQLKPIRIYKNYIIKHYPDKKTYTLTEYFQWKVDNIKEIIIKWLSYDVKFHIFDDLEDLFPILFREIPHIATEYNCKLIQEQSDWAHIAKVET